MIFVLLVLSAALVHTQVAALQVSVRNVGQMSRQYITRYQRAIATRWQSPQGRRRIAKYTGIATAVTAAGVIAYLLRSSKAGGKKASTTSLGSTNPVSPRNATGIKNGRQVLPPTPPAKASAQQDTNSPSSVTPAATSPENPTPISTSTASLTPLPQSARASLVSQPNAGNNNITNTPPAAETTPIAMVNGSPVGQSPVMVSPGETAGDLSSGQPTPDLGGSEVLINQNDAQQ